MKCYNSKLESVSEVDSYFDMRESMFTIAKKVVKNLGLWYEDLSNIVDTYISNWIQLGFDEDVLNNLSLYAFKSSVRTLEGFNNQVLNMFKLGVLTKQSLDNYMEEIVKSDSVIAEMLQSMGLDRAVNSMDRTFYKTWLYDWKISEDVLNYAIEQAKGKYMPMQYLNKLLSDIHVAGIDTVAGVKELQSKQSVKVNVQTTSSSKQAKNREYSKKELDSLFDNIYEVEI